MERTTQSPDVNILLVDDHEENLIALESILTNSDYRLVKCTSGNAALRELLRYEFAVVLLDVMMPDMDGFELASLIRRRLQSRYTPLIFLTALAKEGQHRYRGYSVGAVDYIHKPLEPEIVVAKVGVFVELFRKSKLIELQAERLRQSELREREFEILKITEASERRYHQLAEAIPQIVWRALPSGEICYFNKQWRDYESVQATRPDELTSGGWEAYEAAFHRDDFPRFLAAWQAALVTHEAFEQQCRLKRRGSSQYRWHLCRALPECDRLGQVEAWVGTWTDIHSQKQVEERQRFLARAAKGLASSLDYVTTLKSMAALAVPDLADWCVVDIRDADGNLRRAEIVHSDSGKASLVERLKGLPLGHSEQPFGLAVSLQNNAPVLCRTLDENELAELAESELHCAIYRELGVHSLVSVPLNVRGQVLGALTLLVGRSRRGYDEEDLNLAGELTQHAGLAIDNARLYRVLQEANRMKDEFLATVSHELRTPLSAVIGWSDMLMKGDYDEDTRQSLEIIGRNAHSLARLVEDLLDVSRIISGKVLLSIQTTELEPLIAAAVETLRPAAMAKEIELVCAVDGGIGGIAADPARMQQVAWNLLSNAIKFTPRGGQVRVSLYRDSEGETVLQVADNGLGIHKDFIPHIFDRFSQADGTTTRQSGGLGLGLAIVRHLVELHGGLVKAESSGVGRGSVFTVTLPAHAQIGAVCELSDGVGGFFSPVASCELPSLEGVEVLVVDDQEDTRTLIAKILTGSGAQVRRAGTVREALAACKEQRPHVILSDLSMPVEDGFGLLEHLRRCEQTDGSGRVPVAAVTAHAGEINRDRVQTAGFDAYITKPIQFPALIHSVAYLTGRVTASVPTVNERTGLD